MAMIMKKHALFSCILASLGLTGCGAEDTILADVCAGLEGATYYSTTLEESGATPDGINLGHWQIRFADGEAQMFQSDFGLVGTYACSDKGVELTVFEEVQVLDFNDDFTALQFNPLAGDPLTYVRSDLTGENFGDCDSVRGKSYRTVAAAADSEDTSTDLIAPPNIYISFADNQVVESNLTMDGSAFTGIYECSMGELHVHEDADDETPLVLTTSADGVSVTAVFDGRKYELFSETGGGVCAEIYEPVCGIENRNIQCITTPCDNQFYKTYGNQCHAINANSPIVHEGECGEKEGEPVGQACTREYDPVCGAQNSTRPCLSAPCPKLEYNTFGNQCEANAAGAIFLFSGECGDKEGEELSNLSEYMACTAQYDPVCAKVTGNLQCITTPCPTHEYRTFGNACEARVSGASFIAAGECPKTLVEMPVTAEPPVILVEELPEVRETVRVVESRISGDVLTVKLGYSGCSEQHVSMLALDEFLESDPVQVSYTFQSVVEDFCDAYFETEFVYDLMPLRLAYSRSYNGAGKILIPEVGLYEFEMISESAE